MPNLPLAASATRRYFVDYTSMGIEHTVMFRLNGAPADPGEFLSDILVAMTGCMLQQDTITTIRLAQIGSDVTFPVGFVNAPGLLSNVSAIADDPESVFLSTPFRGAPAGRKGRYDFFFPGNFIPLDANNRFPWGSVGGLANLEDALQAAADVGSESIQLVDIGNERILFNGYWNRAKSGYWQRRQRRG